MMVLPRVPSIQYCLSVHERLFFIRLLWAGSTARSGVPASGTGKLTEFACDPVKVTMAITSMIDLLSLILLAHSREGLFLQLVVADTILEVLPALSSFPESDGDRLFFRDTG